MNAAKSNQEPTEAEVMQQTAQTALKDQFDPRTNPVFEKNEGREEAVYLAAVMLKFVKEGAPSDRLPAFVAAAVYLAILVRAEETWRTAP